MTTRRFLLASAPMLVVGLVLAGGSLTAWTLARPAPPAAAPPSVPGGVLRVLHAEPFTLEQGYAFAWRRERPTLDAGILLVLEVDPQRVVARQELEPVLYVGAQTAERVNHGANSGRVVAIVPALRDGAGEPDLDLASTAIWFGTPALPEQVDAARIQAEVELARRAGVRPLAVEHIAPEALSAAAPARLRDRTELQRRAAQLLLTWSPADRELAQGMLAPLVR